jgi:hypothetical protein
MISPHPVSLQKINYQLIKLIDSLDRFDTFVLLLLPLLFPASSTSPPSPLPNFSMKLLAAVAGLIVAAESAALAPLGPQLQNALQSVLSLGKSHLSKPPNILFVITDDQDLELDSISYTPLIEKHLRHKGTFFRNHFVTTALCCPSRVSLWTGRQAHNTNVTDVNPPYGERPH